MQLCNIKCGDCRVMFARTSPLLCSFPCRAVGKNRVQPNRGTMRLISTISFISIHIQRLRHPFHMWNTHCSACTHTHTAVRMYVYPHIQSESRFSTGSNSIVKLFFTRCLLSTNKNTHSIEGICWRENVPEQRHPCQRITLTGSKQT